MSFIHIEVDLVLQRIETLSEKKYLPIIGTVKGKYLVNTVNRYNVKVALEIETRIGYSAILIAKNLPEDGKLFMIERDPRKAEVAEKNIRMANLSDKIDLLVGDAIKLIPGIVAVFDMVFVDEAKGEYFDYLRVSEEKLRKGGVVFADNVKQLVCEMGDYLDYVRNSGRYRSGYLEVGSDGVEISVKM